MLELLIRLEYKRQALRRRVLGKVGISDDSYFGIAVMAILFGLFMGPLTWPSWGIAAGPFWLAMLVLIVGGLLLCATVILAPVGLILL